MLSKIEINNFKCLLNNSISLNKLTLISGINGSGKSSLIQTLLLLRQSYQNNRLFKDGLVLNGDLINIGAAIDALSDSADEDIIRITLGIDEDIIYEWTFDASKNLDYLPNITNNFNKIHSVNNPLFSTGFNFLSPERIGPRVVQQKDDLNVKAFRNLGTSGKYTAHFLNTYGFEKLENDSRVKNNADSLSLLYQTEAWLKEISPNSRLKIKEYLGTDLISVRYSTETSSGTTNDYRATNVGFGLSFSLPVVVSLLAAKPGDIVIIDTPEAHLHPRAQSKMGELIARTAEAGIQVIIETHSDHILNGVRLSIHKDILSKNNALFHFFVQELSKGDVETKIYTPEIDDSGRFNEWPSGFFDEWNANLQQLILPKRNSNVG